MKTGIREQVSYLQETLTRARASFLGYIAALFEAYGEDKLRKATQGITLPAGMECWDELIKNVKDIVSTRKNRDPATLKKIRPLVVSDKDMRR